MQRRTALQQMLAPLVAAALPSALKANEEPSTSPKWKTAIGLNGFASASRKYKQTFPIWEILDYAARTGFDGVELVSSWPMGNYPAVNEAGRVAALKRLYDEFGLQVFSIQTGAGEAFAPDANVRRGWIKRMRGQFALAKALGCDCVGTWPGGGLRGQTIDEAIKHLASSLREAAKIADDMGLVFAFEIEPPFVFNSEEHLKQILERADDSRVKTTYDPSHYDLFNKSTGKPHELLKRIGVEHIGYVHFTDTDGTLLDGGTSRHLPAGDGHIDVPASFQTLIDGGFEGWVMVDAWETPDPYDASTKGIRAIQRAMKRTR